MATFDWIPYLEGKYMTYYQIGALVFSAIACVFSLISYFIFLAYSGTSHTKIKNFAFHSIFSCLSSIPLICAAFDVIFFLEGVILMGLVLLSGEIIKNGINLVQMERK